MPPPLQSLVLEGALPVQVLRTGSCGEWMEMSGRALPLSAALTVP